MEVPIAFILGILYHALILLASVVGEEESIFYGKQKMYELQDGIVSEISDNETSLKIVIHGDDSICGR